ncbi:MAG TPA: J domain-containing protein [Anaeromyxobacteraceae bacterium]|nr:J domain-containing protein [Anaeromyxobacteraceae bacterium]
MPVAALALSPQPLPSLRLLRAEGRVRALLADVLELEDARDALESALAEFSACWAREAGAALAELDDAERLVRRLRRLEDEIDRLVAATLSSGVAEARAPAAGRAAAHPRPSRSGRARPAPRPRPGAAPSGAAGDDAGPDAAVTIEPEDVALKRLHRRLARAVHPDVARGDDERALFAEWMARVNAAYHRRDLAALEVLAEKIGLGDAPGDPSEVERLSRLERRVIALTAARDALARDLERLRSSEAFRLRREAQRRGLAGGDLAAETRAGAAERIAAARADSLRRYDLTAARAADLERALRAGGAGRAGTRRDATGAIAASPLVRRGLALPEIARPGVRALELARELEESARAAEPWECALTLLAFYAEVGGDVPDGLATAAALGERWDLLRSGWPRAPDLSRALARLPRHLDVGVRVRGDGVAAGLQLSSADAVAGVRHALASGALRPLARDVLAACGPRERCEACEATVAAVHLLRTRGLDEVHGVVCPRCGSVLRSYWRYGERHGLECLAPLALELGLVAEAHVRIGRRTVGFQMLPAVRAALTAARLAHLVHALYAQPHELPLRASHLAFQAEGARAALAPDDLVPEGAAVRLRLAGAALREQQVISWVKQRIEERFRR